MQEDCYFEIVETDGKKRMSPKCVECCKGREESMYFWNGSVRGYGRYRVICDTCNKVLYTPKEE